MKIHPPLNKLVVRDINAFPLCIMTVAAFYPRFPPSSAKKKRNFNIFFIISFSIIAYVILMRFFYSLEESADLVTLNITVTLATARLVTPGTIIMGERQR